VYATHISYIVFTYVCDNLFTIHICLTHQYLIQHAGEDGKANAN